MPFPYFSEILQNGTVMDVSGGIYFWSEVTISNITAMDSSNNTITTHYATFSSGIVIGGAANNGLLQLSINAPASKKGTVTGQFRDFTSSIYP